MFVPIYYESCEPYYKLIYSILHHCLRAGRVALLNSGSLNYTQGNGQGPPAEQFQH